MSGLHDLFKKSNDYEVFEETEVKEFLNDDEVEEVWTTTSSYIVFQGDAVLHNTDDEPSVVVTVSVDGKDAKVTEQTWHRFGKLHRGSGPAHVVHHVYGDETLGTTDEHYFHGKSFDQLKIVALSKGFEPNSWDELVAFLKREQI